MFTLAYHNKRTAYYIASYTLNWQNPLPEIGMSNIKVNGVFESSISASQVHIYIRSISDNINLNHTKFTQLAATG